MVNTNTSDIVLEERANGVLAFNAITGQYYGFYPYRVWTWHDTTPNVVDTQKLTAKAPNQRIYAHYAEITCAIDTAGASERHCQLTGIQDNEERVMLELCIAPSTAPIPCNEVRRIYPGLLFDAGSPITYYAMISDVDVTGFAVVYAEIDDIRG